MKLRLCFSPCFKVLIGYRTGSCFLLLLEECLGHASLGFKELTFVEREVLVPILHRVVYGSRDALVQLAFQLGKVLVLRLVLFT